MAERPGYHITAPRHWLNDPNGPLRWNGRWHLFFQYNPEIPAWGPPHWGHVSSSDLVTWQRHRVALAPTPDGQDRDGCWSGCARIVDGVPTIFYTGVVGHTDATRVESVMRATSSGDLLSWHKDPVSLIASPPATADTGVHRDPFTFTGDREYLLLGSAMAAEGGLTGSVLVYHLGPDGNWVHGGVFFDGRGDWGIDTGVIWECPLLLRFDTGDVLVVSVADPGKDRQARHAMAFVGRVVDGRFEAERAQLIDRGDLFYAPTTMSWSGRQLMWGWIQELAPDLGPTNAERRVGALSLPRNVDLVAGHVVCRPAPELVALRTSSDSYFDRPLTPSTPIELELPAHAEVTFTLTGTDVMTLGLGRGWDGSDAQVSVAPRGNRGSDVQVFVDGDVVEVFATGHAPYTTRTAGRPRLTVMSDSSALVTGLTIHHIRSNVIGA